MFDDLNWGGALKRAGLTVLFYLGLVYVLNVAVPGSYGGPVALAINALFLFVLFTLFHAYIDRRRRRREAQLRAQKKGKQPPGKAGAKTTGAKATAAGEDDGEVAPEGTLKGRHNPNTSRKKASRRRR